MICIFHNKKNKIKMEGGCKMENKPSFLHVNLLPEEAVEMLSLRKEK